MIHPDQAEDVDVINIAETSVNGFIHESDQVKVVIKSAAGQDFSFSPKEGMKPLKDLINHLAQIPSLDFGLYKMDIENIEQAQKMEKDLNRETIDEMLEVFEKGINKVVEYFKVMTDNEFLEEKLTPCYMKGPPKAWAYYLSEMTRHLAMHKMQLWMYLKLAGAPVDMMTYYGVTSE